MKDRTRWSTNKNIVRVPGAIDNEDAFSDGESAVVPHQQEVEQCIDPSEIHHTK